MLKHILIPSTDLRILELKCKCGARLTLDLQGYRGLAIKGCTVCGEDYAPRAIEDIAAFAKVYANAQPKHGDPNPPGHQIAFLIESE